MVPSAHGHRLLSVWLRLTQGISLFLSIGISLFFSMGISLFLSMEFSALFPDHCVCSTKTESRRTWKFPETSSVPSILFSQHLTGSNLLTICWWHGTAGSPESTKTHSLSCGSISTSVLISWRSWQSGGRGCEGWVVGGGGFTDGRGNGLGGWG